MAGEFATGTAPLPPVRHDDGTARILAGYRARREADTDAEVLAAAAALERPAASRHPLCAEFRAIVDAQLDARHLSLAELAGGAA
ncbi:hypothetical protein [Micromonospora sp. CB01531]|uniref:hypothetical protein n=1 Tax=Micromonospora sp. CB01531 TaxID=1718947 RepID=UPI00093BCA16|nr:hypothetical protein [Micromonospora sp. CB01531]OKI47264.1 hypothetical protein A6A27_10475 [Micromonospora sp. CB01531]